MDDDRKVGDGDVTDLIERSKLTFLQGILDDFQRRQSRYDIGREFAKTRKNRNALVPLLVAGLTLLLAAGAFGVTWYIQQQTRSIDVGISDDFQDIALREVLDSAKRLDTEMDQAQRRLSARIRARTDEIASVRDTASREIELLEYDNLTQGQRADRVARINAQADADIDAIVASYSDEIASIEVEIEGIEDEMLQYDTRQLEMAREQEEVLDDQRRLFELQLAQQQAEYESTIQDLTTGYETRIDELKAFQDELEQSLTRRHNAEIAALYRLYNPIFANDRAADLLAAARVRLPALDAGVLETRGDTETGGADGARSDEAAIQPESVAPPEISAAYDDYLRSAAGISRSAYREAIRQLQAANAVFARIEAVPYEGSIPEALAFTKARYAAAVGNLEIVWQRLLETVRMRDSVIADRDTTILDLEATVARYEFALDALTAANRENGYIIDPRNPENIIVHLDRIREPAEGAVGYVFREDDQLIGTVELLARENGTVGRLLEVEPGSVLKPYDKILIQERR